MLDPFLPDFLTSFSAVPAGVAFLRMLSALVLGGVIGFERETHGKPAGLRTQMLVSVAA